MKAIFYDTWYEGAMNILGEDGCKALVWSAVQYQLAGITPNLPEQAMYLFNMIKPSMNLHTMRSAAGAKGGANTQKQTEQANTQKQTEQANTQKQTEQADKDKDKDKEKEKDKDKEKEIRPLRPLKPLRQISQPTLEEVERYIAEKGLTGLVDPLKFCAHYEDTGWTRSDGTPITHWRKCVATWAQNAKRYQHKKGEGKRDFSEYD